MTRLPLMVCPACGAEMTLDVALGHDGARDAVLALAHLDRASGLLPATVRYLALFSPPGKKPRLDRFARLVREVADLVEPAKLEFHGRILPAPRDYWVAAMDEMTGPRRDSLTLPMKSHGYLKTIVAGYSDKAAAAAENAREASRGGRTPPAGLPPPPPPAPEAPKTEAPRKRLTADEKAALRAALAGQPTPEPPAS